MPMNPEIKAKWLEALRGGNYKQGTHALKKHDCFCCLGVLSDIWAKETGKRWKRASQDIRSIEDYGTYEIGGSYDILPNEVAKWAGLETTHPTVLYTFDDVDGKVVSYQEQLTFINDECKLSFNDIAELIEENL
jgi:hypothetical protein